MICSLGEGSTSLLHIPGIFFLVNNKFFGLSPILLVEYCICRHKSILYICNRMTCESPQILARSCRPCWMKTLGLARMSPKSGLHLFLLEVQELSVLFSIGLYQGCAPCFLFQSISSSFSKRLNLNHVRFWEHQGIREVGLKPKLLHKMSFKQAI